jgi:hypothetical protein
MEGGLSSRSSDVVEAYDSCDEKFVKLLRGAIGDWATVTVDAGTAYGASVQLSCADPMHCDESDEPSCWLVGTEAGLLAATNLRTPGPLRVSWSFVRLTTSAHASSFHS